MAQLCHMKQQGNQFAISALFGYYAKNVDDFVIWIKENYNIIEYFLTQDILNFSSSKRKL